MTRKRSMKLKNNANTKRFSLFRGYIIRYNGFFSNREVGYFGITIFANRFFKKTFCVCLICILITGLLLPGVESGFFQKKFQFFLRICQEDKSNFRKYYFFGSNQQLFKMQK